MVEYVEDDEANDCHHEEENVEGVEPNAFYQSEGNLSQSFNNEVSFKSTFLISFNNMYALCCS